MVSVAVACPLASKVTESRSSEQVGADCVGCTEQVSVTALSNALSKFRLTVEVELCPRRTVSGLGVDAEMEKSVLAALSSTLRVLSLFTVTRSGVLSPLRSNAAAPKMRFAASVDIKVKAA